MQQDTQATQRSSAGNGAQQGRHERQAAIGTGWLLPERSAPLTVLVRQLLQLRGVLCAPFVKHVHMCLEHADVGPHLQVWQRRRGQGALVSRTGAQARQANGAAEGSAGAVMGFMLGVAVIASMGVSAELPVGALVCSERWLTLLNHPAGEACTCAGGHAF